MTKTFRDYDRGNDLKEGRKEERIPFELSAKSEKDFYNKANIQHLEEQAKLYKKGKMKLVKKSLDDLGIEK